LASLRTRKTFELESLLAHYPRLPILSAISSA
jgi:hypothetical protein